jgi:protein-tyrosine phosphatase
MTAVDLEGAYNVRDLGGLRTRDKRRTRYGLIYRGDSLDSITPADSKMLFGELGIGTIVDLRTKDETDLVELSFPVQRCRFSVLAEGRLGREPFPSDDPAELAKVYLGNLEGGRAAVKSTFDVIAGNLREGVPTLFHCAAGRDRTGIMAALLLDLVDVTFGEIARDYVQSNRNARRVTQKLAENPLYANHEAHMREIILLHEQTVLGFLRLLQAQDGGSRQFCLDSGLSEETLAVLCDLFVGDADDGSRD